MSTFAMSIPVLVVGLGFGVRHALDADHLAAVATLVGRRTTWPEAARLGICWGLGHTLTLALLAGVMVPLGEAVPDRVASLLELIVGFMLVALGLDCLRRAGRSFTQEHAHRDEDGLNYVHRHLRFEGPNKRAVLVGMVHGLAGSAALIVLAVESAGSAVLGLSYVVIFGVGSIIGMGLLSLALGLGVRLCALRAEWICHALTVASALFSLGLGATIVYRIGFVQGFFFGTPSF